MPEISSHANRKITAQYRWSFSLSSHCSHHFKYCQEDHGMHFARYFSICGFTIVLKLMANPNPPTIPNAEDELNWKKLLEYTTIVQNLSDRISSLQKSAFALANYYFVSQAVVFTALCSNSSLVCRDVWFPLFVSLLPGALNLFAFFKVGQEYIKTVISQKKCKTLKRDREVHMSGRTLTSLLDDEDTEYVENKEKERLTVILYSCMCAVGFLAAVIAVGSLWMLRGENIIVKHNAKCVKLCM